MLCGYLVLGIGAVAILGSGCAALRMPAYSTDFSSSLGSGAASAPGKSDDRIPNRTSYDLAIVADDGTFLGRPGSSYGSDSIANSYGQHGNNWSRSSMFSDTSPYGSKYGTESAMNSSALNPPKLYRGKTFVGYVTTNKAKYPRIDPVQLRQDGKQNKYIMAR